MVAVWILSAIGKLNTMMLKELDTSRRRELFGKIERVLTMRGIRGCTMDVVAATLGMSKRTLYEIFGSKDVMIKSILSDMNTRNRSEVEKIFADTPNVMDAMARYVFHTQDSMCKYSSQFLEELYASPELRRRMREDSDRGVELLMGLVRQGLRQGVFRRDVDYPVMLRLLNVQYGSLTCMRDIFPPQVTMAQAFENITIGFLRSIASPRGMEILDGIISAQASAHPTDEEPNIDS